MTELKAQDVEALLQRKVLPYSLFVIHGPDRGLVSERASAIAALSGVDLKDAFSLVRMDTSDLGSMPGRLVEEMQSIGLFGGKRLVWLRCSGGEKPVADALQILSETDLADSMLIVEAGEVRKASGVRKVADPSRKIASIACYADDDRMVHALIDAELAPSGLRITPDARQLLTESLGGDRLASRNELRKLALYCMGEGTIEEHHVREIIGDASAISVEELVDAVLAGDRAGLVHAADKIATSKTPIFLGLLACIRQFQQLDTMRAEMDEKRLQPGAIMQTWGKGIHFKRKPLVEKALRTWTAPALQQALNRLQTTVLATRQHAPLEDSIAMQTLLSLTLQSARRP